MLSVRTPTQVNRVYRFGDFEFSVRSGELLKNGSLVRLQYQPLRVLLVLLENAGDAVTRDEIRERVWHDAPIQDFDNSLRVAVAKLRQALGDDPETPQYIETLPRRGYRWLYPVTVQDHPSKELAGDTLEIAQASSPAGRESGTDASKPVTKSERSKIYVRSGALTLVLWLIAIAVLLLLRPKAASPDPRIRPLTTYPGLETTPALSPDGTRVAFAWTGPNASDPYRVYVKPVGDDRASRLTETPTGASDGDPVWSPDGKLIYFFRRGGGHSGIYVAPVDGGPARQLLVTSMDAHRVRRSRFDISPTGQTLVYPDALPGQETAALFLLDLSTMQSRQITNPPMNSEGDGDPVFSHDGRTLAFQREALDLGQVYVMPAGGGTERLLTSGFIADFIDGLAWTADDRAIVFGGKQLRRVSAAGGESAITNVPYVPGPAAFPSIRNHSLAYVQATTNANVWKLDLRDATHPAGEPSKLISSTRQQAAASFSPDGSRLAFQSDRSGNWEIWTCNRDGSNAVQLTHSSAVISGTPRWSPDGKQIAFDSRANGIPQIYVVSSDGGEPRVLTHGSVGSAVPSWSRDGTWVYYSATNGSATNIWRVPAEGGNAEPVTNGSGIYAMESSDGRYVYYSRSALDSTIWRIPVGGGAEEKVPGVPRPFDPSHWAMVATGIYVIDGNGDLYFYQFEKSRATKVLHDQRFITDWSMAVSPDGREIVWAQIDERLADMMLVENFH